MMKLYENISYTCEKLLELLALLEPIETILTTRHGVGPHVSTGRRRVEASWASWWGFGVALALARFPLSDDLRRIPYRPMILLMAMDSGPIRAQSRHSPLKGTIGCAGSVIGVGGKACRTWNAFFACGLFVVVATALSARYLSRGGDLARSTRLADAIFSCCARAAGDARNVLTWVLAARTRFTCSQQNALRAIANHRNSQGSNGLLEQQWIFAEGRLSCTLGLVRCTEMEKFAGAH